MKIAIIGAGFGGLAAAYELAKSGAEVTVFEATHNPGGLAGGFYEDNWHWPLDYHYHHVFENDRAVKKLLFDLNLTDQLFFQKAATYGLSKTKNLNLARIDSVLSLLLYPNLSLVSKIRTGATLAGLKLFSSGQSLEKHTAMSFIKKTMGDQSWQELWQPLFSGKFGTDASQINAAWFWARIYTRSQKLGYFNHGFLGIAQQMVDKLKQLGVEFCFDCEVSKIEASKKTGCLHSSLNITANKIKTSFDQAIFTAGSQQLIKLVPNLPKQYLFQLKKLKSLAAMTLVLVLDKSFFKQNIYWLNVNRVDWPFLAVVEHTNFIDSKNYDFQHLVYVGKYLSEKDKFFKASPQQVLACYQPFLKKLSPDFDHHLIKVKLFKNNQAQPLVKNNHSVILPKVKTPIKNLYWISMQHVYPYDRGINYAIQLGRDTAQSILINQF